MTDPTPGADRFDVTPTAESHFSWLRTRMSTERTLMSWIRTSTALIGFGFTIFQFFDKLPEMSSGALVVRPETPRYLGLTLILAGILALAIATWQYHWLTGYLHSQSFSAIAGVAEHPKRTPTLTVAVVLIVIGIFAFLSVFFRLK